ncbi:hypothetical protein PG991_013372 [Apiospora marii]|uniref:Smr domain-containing protein n=1 Tax=Apiospora marii TaxID=335849 RepID=A0ABR1R5S5_9PEZI
MSHGRNGVPRLLKAPLPVTACVNHESRQETLRKYSKVPTSSPFFSFMSIQGSICDVSDVMNYEIDSVRLDCCPLRRITVRQFPPVVLQRLRRIEATLPCRRVTYTVGGGGHKSFDNFLRYVVAAFFPSLRELTVELDLDLHLGENVSFKIVGASCLGVARSIGEKPLFLRTVGEGVSTFLCRPTVIAAGTGRRSMFSS